MGGFSRDQKRLASSGGEDASCAENAKFREVLEALRLEKRTLQERVQQMASNGASGLLFLHEQKDCCTIS